MAVRTVLRFPDSRLRNQAVIVNVFDQPLQTLVGDMLETMYHRQGVGLAANQIGAKEHIFVADVSRENNEPLVFVNLEILEKQNTVVHEEGCLSFPGVYVEVSRAEWVHIRAQDAQGQPFELETSGLLAICIQHELDHLQGKTFVDYLSPLKRNRLLAKYKKALAESTAS